MSLFSDYAARLQTTLGSTDWSPAERLAQDMLRCWQEDRTIYFCGNGGSAANASHLANDFIYGVAKSFGRGIKTHCLASNAAVMTCLANDIGYEKVFSHQLAVLGEAGDIVVVLSGSGNSPNIVEVLRVAREKKITSYGILGYSGGKAKELADHSIHFPIDDMQISEDLQLTVGHMAMQWLYANNPLKGK